MEEGPPELLLPPKCRPPPPTRGTVTGLLVSTLKPLLAHTSFRRLSANSQRHFFTRRRDEISSLARTLPRLNSVGVKPELLHVASIDLPQLDLASVFVPQQGPPSLLVFALSAPTTCTASAMSPPGKGLRRDLLSGPSAPPPGCTADLGSTQSRQPYLDFPGLLPVSPSRLHTLVPARNPPAKQRSPGCPATPCAWPRAWHGPRARRTSQ